MKKQRVFPTFNALSAIQQSKLRGGCPDCDTGPEAPNPPNDPPTTGTDDPPIQ